MKNKIKTIIIIFLTISFCMFSLSNKAIAHSPQDIQLEYNYANQTLIVTITHDISDHYVNDPNDHFINETMIKKNGVLYHSETHQSQGGTVTFTNGYSVKAIEGDILEVTAYCIQDNGSITKEIIIDVNDPPDKPILQIPGNSEKNITIDAILIWDCTDPDGDNLLFDVYFGTSSQPQVVSKNQSSKSFTPDLDNNTKYYWKIVAWDEHGLNSISDLWTFETAIIEEIDNGIPWLYYFIPLILIGGGITLFIKYRKKPDIDKNDDEDDEEEDDEEKKKANYLISAVKYDKNHSHIIKVRTHEYKDDKIGPAFTEDRDSIVNKLLNNKTYHTIKKNSIGKESRGAKIKIRKIKNKNFIRTDNNDTETDNLEELPEF